MRYVRWVAIMVLLSVGIGKANIIDDARDFFNSKSAGMGIPSLKLGVGAKNLALGGGILSRDATLLFWNPSLIPLVSGFNASFSHSSQFLGTRYEFAGMVWGDEISGYGIGVKYFTAGDIELRDSRQMLYGTYSPFSLVSYFSYGRKSGDIWLGGSFKYIYERCHVYSLRGYAMDFGFNYIPISTLNVAFAVSNMGPRVSYGIEGSTPIKLPLTFEFSTGYEFKKFGFSASFRKALDEVFTAGVGVEYTPNPYITLRMGERVGYDLMGASFGFGVNYARLALDYAYLPFELDLGSSHHITIAIK